MGVDRVEIAPGYLLAGKYELLRLIGKGSMGEVWVANHKTLGAQVAVKLLTPPPGDEIENAEAAAARFRFEGQIAARLSGKTRHIVRVTDHGEEKGLAYIVMELLEGQTLGAMLMHHGGRLDAEVVVDMITQIARALACAHAEGVFHRDLKPANVFVARDEDGRVVLKVLDFGIARAVHAHRVRGSFATAQGLVFGTPEYMSPEQALASSKLDHRCDLWSLAVVAYEALTGEMPIEGADTDEILKNLCAGRMVPLRQRMPEGSPALAAFFDRAFADSIDDRFDNAAELASAFARVALPAEPHAKAKVSWRAGAGAVAVAAVAGAVVLLRLVGPSAGSAREPPPGVAKASDGLPQSAQSVAANGSAGSASSALIPAAPVPSMGEPTLSVSDLPRAPERAPERPVSAARGALPATPPMRAGATPFAPAPNHPQPPPAQAPVPAPAPVAAPPPARASKPVDKSDVL